MSVAQLITRASIGLCFAVVAPRVVSGQERLPGGGPLAGPPTLNAAYSADATTIVRQKLPDGTLVERRAMARYYRDGSGRVRVEQIIPGAGELRITVAPDPASPSIYTIDPATRTMSNVMRFVADQATGGGDTFALPLGRSRFLLFHRPQAFQPIGVVGYDSIDTVSLGHRLIGAIDATGSRTTMTVSDSKFDHGRPFEVVEERWDSPDLNLLIESHHVDPRIGVIEYQLANISRVDPPSDLFEVPADYTPRTYGKDAGISLWPANPWDAVTVAVTGARR